MACEEVREEDAERPDLCRCSLVWLLAQNLGRCIRCRAEEKCVEWCWGVGVRHNGAAEVDELNLSEDRIVLATMCRGEEEHTHLVLAIDDKILVLDVAMRNTLAFEIAHRLDDLCKDISRMIFR